jgi:cation:H+ antiporter
VIGLAGVALTSRAERIARVTGVGQALLGGVLIGAVTSLPGIITSVSAAATGHPTLAVSNALGGIAAQTVFLVVADMFYRRANLEHAAASEQNLTLGVLLIALLAVPWLGATSPPVTLFAVHPATFALFVGYIVGLAAMSKAQSSPMWYPRHTPETAIEPKGSGDSGERIRAGEWLTFLGLVLLVAAAGWVVARTGIRIAAITGLSESVVGTLFTAISTSLPELVIAVAAVRRGAVALAVGDVIGGNTFDVLLVGMSDVAYRDGSIYHAAGEEYGLWLALTVLLNAILLLGMLRRQKHGVGNIGFESALVLVLYLLAVGLLFSG